MAMTNDKTVESEPTDARLPYIELKGITHSYGPVLALNNINLGVPWGEIVGLVGDNGAGKSTLNENPVRCAPADER